MPQRRNGNWAARLHLPTLAVVLVLGAGWSLLSRRYGAYVLPSPAAAVAGLWPGPAGWPPPPRPGGLVRAPGWPPLPRRYGAYVLPSPAAVVAGLWAVLASG